MSTSRVPPPAGAAAVAGPLVKADGVEQAVAGLEPQRVEAEVDSPPLQSLEHHTADAGATRLR